MSGTSWYDYTMMFPLTGWAQALAFLTAVRNAGFMGGAGNLPDNMLGDPRDAEGNIVAPPTTPDGPDLCVFNGRPGRAAFSYTDPMSGLVVNVPAAGDPTMMYVAIRSPLSPAQSAALQASLNLHPADYGITPSDPAVSAAVLGMWA